MPKCSYCESIYEWPKGTTVVSSISSKIRYFCSSKCRKNFEKTRKKRKWATKRKK